jgi:nucleoside-diphosphate-sugar epimerase
MIEEDLQIILSGLKQFSSKISGKTFLVTGGSGFLGSWICETLAGMKAKIICVDNLSSGLKENIEKLVEDKKIIFIEVDASSFDTNDHIDYIIHMASIASPLCYQKYPIETLDANTLGTKRMLDIARKNNATMLYTSTSEVYGETEKIPTPENYYGYVNSYGPRSVYDEGKRVAEAYCYAYWKTFGTKVRIARIFNTYGPRLDAKQTSQYGRAVIKFIEQALSNKPVTIYGNGEQTRSFCYINDLIKGLIKMLLTSGLDGEVVNLGNDEEVTILELANKIISLTNSKSKIKFEALPKDDPKRRCPDLSKARKILDYETKVPLDIGLKKTIEWFKER